MEYEFAERVKKVQPSATLGITTLAKAMKADGIDVIGLGAGEPDFDTPDHIKEAAEEAIREGFTKYTPVGGINELKDAIIEKFQRDNGLSYDRAQIFVSCGAKHSIYNLFQALCGPGDEVIVPAPYWLSYPDQVCLAGATPVIVETNEAESFRLSADRLREAVTGATRILVLNSPSNPTGAAYPRSELEKIAEVAIEKDFLILSDEIYESIVYDGFTSTSIASLGDEVKERTLLVNGVSKTYAMTGWRIGYFAADASVAAAVNKIQGHSTSNPTSIAQRAAVAAITGPQEAVAEMTAAFAGRRDALLDRFGRIPGVTCYKPQGAFYLFPRVSAYYGRGYGGKSVAGSKDMAKYLLEEAQVAVVPGEAFGADDCIRISYAASMESLGKGLDRIEEALSSLE